MSSEEVALIFEDFLKNKTTCVRRYLRVFADYWAEQNRRDEILKLTSICTGKMGKEMLYEMVTVVEALTRTEMDYVTAVISVWIMQGDRRKASIEVYFKMLTDERNNRVCWFKAHIEKIIGYWTDGRMTLDAKQLERLMHICAITKTSETEVHNSSSNEYQDEVIKKKKKLESLKNTKAYFELFGIVAKFYVDVLKQNPALCNDINQGVVDCFYAKYGPIFQQPLCSFHYMN